MQVHLQEHELRLKRRWEIAGGGIVSKRNAFVRLVQDGFAGEGEAAFHGGFGESAQSVWDELQRAAELLRPVDTIDIPSLGLTGAARAAMDMAWTDLQARREGVSLATFLGLPEQSEPLRTSYSIGIDDPAAMAGKVAEVRESEFEVLKVKMGSANDRENFRAIRSATDLPIRIDANGGWETRENAARMIAWLAADGAVELIEQPLPAGRLEDHAWLRERAELPLFLDEDVAGASDLPGLAGTCDGVNLKLMKTGGTFETLHAIQVARQHDLQIMLGCMIESSLAIAAALHLAGQVDCIDLDGHLLIANDPYQGIELAGGRLLPPPGPGIGVVCREW